MVTVLVDTSALFALLDGDDVHHGNAVRLWESLVEVDLVTHGYVVAESFALTRGRLGWPAAAALIDRLLPTIRVEVVDRGVHEAALSDYRTLRGGTSFVDRVTIAFAKHHDVTTCIGFDADLVAAGLEPLSQGLGDQGAISSSFGR